MRILLICIAAIVAIVNVKFQEMEPKLNPCASGLRP